MTETDPGETRESFHIAGHADEIIATGFEPRGELFGAGVWFAVSCDAAGLMKGGVIR